MGGVSRTLASEYDPSGRHTRPTFPDSVYFTYEYDAAGRLTTIRENGATAGASMMVDAGNGCRREGPPKLPRAVSVRGRHLACRLSQRFDPVRGAPG